MRPDNFLYLVSIFIDICIRGVKNEFEGDSIVNTNTILGGSDAKISKRRGYHITPT